MPRLPNRCHIDITSWLLWFLGCLDQTIRDAGTQLGEALEKARLRQEINRHPLNERQRKIIDRLLGHFQGHLTTSKYAKLVKCSNDTALRDIRDLLARAIIVRNPGGGRSTSYRPQSAPPPDQRPPLCCPCGPDAGAVNRNGSYFVAW